MYAQIVIGNLLLAKSINMVTLYGPDLPLIKLFGVPPIFVIKFFGELILLFLASALISYILKIDKASND